MRSIISASFWLAGLLCVVVQPLVAAPLTATLVAPPPASSAGFHMGTAVAPGGTTIAVDGRSLLLDGKRWTPVMGEFHFSRYPADEWREELVKIKEGGINIVSTYVFWIHHEEEEGHWDWTGCRDLRKFIEIAKAVGLKAVVRCGPWCHGEVRNGGTPDWVLRKGWKLRSNDPRYLEKCRLLYEQIAAQLSGLLWKDGGPVIGIQLENEFHGAAEHMLTLKRIAREVGLDVPLYTRTGWTDTHPPLTFGEILPLYGAYAEGFWDRSSEPMPGNYWTGFQFDSVRHDGNIEQGPRDEEGPDERLSAATYPFLTCEIGGGMMSAYHRRIRIDPRDVEAITLVKLGSGSNLLGYYMYHGGINPNGKLTALMETQDGMWNDMPVKNYDFQAPLGEYGQIRPHYYLLRRLHLFLHDFGAQLADTATVLPDDRPRGKDDEETLRWAARSDGRSGFIFVSNHERLKTLPAKICGAISAQTHGWRDVDVSRDARSTFRPMPALSGRSISISAATRRSPGPPRSQSVSVTMAASARTFSLKLRASRLRLRLKNQVVRRHKSRRQTRTAYHFGSTSAATAGRFNSYC